MQKVFTGLHTGDLRPLSHVKLPSKLLQYGPNNNISAWGGIVSAADQIRIMPPTGSSIQNLG